MNKRELVQALFFFHDDDEILIEYHSEIAQIYKSNKVITDIERSGTELLLIAEEVKQPSLSKPSELIWNKKFKDFLEMEQERNQAKRTNRNYASVLREFTVKREPADDTQGYVFTTKFSKICTVQEADELVSELLKDVSVTSAEYEVVL